jgi:hypothetical protein
VALSIKDAVDLQNSLSVVMTRLAGDLDKISQNKETNEVIKVKMDGGNF